MNHNISTWPRTWESGDTYFLAPGIYSGTTIDEPVTIKAAGEHSTDIVDIRGPLYLTAPDITINGGGDQRIHVTISDAGRYAVWFDKSNTELIGMDIEHSGINNGGAKTDAIYCNPLSGMIHGTVIRNCHVHDANRCLLLLNMCDLNIIEDNVFERVSSGDTVATHPAGLSINRCGDPSDSRLRNNVFRNMNVTGMVEIKDNKTHPSQGSWGIYGNVFVQEAGWGAFQGIICNTGGDTNNRMNVYNNTFNIKGGVSGIWWNAGVGNVTTRNYWTPGSPVPAFLNAGPVDNLMPGEDYRDGYGAAGYIAPPVDPPVDPPPPEPPPIEIVETHTWYFVDLATDPVSGKRVARLRK